MIMKNIVITIPDFCTGGAEKMVAEIASGINKQKFHVTVLALRKQLFNDIESSISSEVEIIYLNKGKGFDFKTLLKCYCVLLSIKPDIIHTHIQSFMYVIPYVFLHNVKMLHTIHNIPEEESKGLRRKALSFLFKHNKAIPVGISDTISKQIKDLYEIDNVETVYNPVDETIFYPKSERYHDRNIIKYISVGRLVDQKNFILLINAFLLLSKKYDNVELNILGDGADREKLEKLIADNSLTNINLLGNVNNVADYLRDADVFVLASKFEGLPMTVLEAMSVGLPCVCTNVGGNKDIITDNGVLVDEPTEDNFCSALETMMSKEFRVKCANASLNNVKKYYLRNTVILYEILYNKYSS